MPWDDDNYYEYRKSVNSLSRQGYEISSDGHSFESPKDKPWMTGGYIDYDGKVHYDM